MKYRDLTLFDLNNGQCWLTACDASASIGIKECDAFQVAPEFMAAFTVRVPLLEFLCVKAEPELVMSLCGNEWEPFGRQYDQAIRQELIKAGLSTIEINGSTEENMPTRMSSLGITISGRAEKNHLLMNKVQNGSSVFQVGRPCVGPEVVEYQEELVTYEDVRWLRELDCIQELVPIGSKGSLNEAQQVAQVNICQFELADRVDYPEWLLHSGGPATSLVVVGTSELEKQLQERFKHYMYLGEMRKD